ncbi:MAG TPA: retropepsin-like aspartic protease [Chlamydiales bacterium]|nr:retropepsin-like aspartic protease [Chlamydiales bacterium]
MDDLYSLCNVQAVQRIITRSDFANFDRDFQRIAYALADQKIAAETEIDRQYWLALDPAFRERVKNRLEIVKPDHSPRCPWSRKDVKDCAMKLLENAPGSVPDLPVSRAVSSGPIPVSLHTAPIKTESFSMDEMMNKLGLMISHSLDKVSTNIATQLQAYQLQDPYQRITDPHNSRPQPNYHQRPSPPQNFNQQRNYNNNSNNFQSGYRQNNRPRGEGVIYGPPGSRPRTGCYMCLAPDHFLSGCDVYMRYLVAGKIKKFPDGRYRLGNGDELPDGPPGTSWQQRIDEHFTRHQTQQQPQATNGPIDQNSNAPNVQTNFVSVFAVPEVNIVDDSEQQIISALRGQLNLLVAEAVTAPQFERASIETSITVLNTRLQKREEALKAKTKAKVNRPETNRAEPKTMHPIGPVPHVEVPHISREKQPKPPPAVQVPLPMARGPPGPQYKFRAPVESDEAHKKVYDKILEQTVILTVEECIATMPTVRRYFKDAITGRRVSTEEEKAAGMVEVGESELASGYHMTVESGPVNFEAKPSLPLRCIEIWLNDVVKVDAILDTGCQVILMRKDVWARLRVPLSAQKIMSMESANGTRNFTSGVVPRVKMTVGSVHLWCPIQVVENAPFEMLLGRPFNAIGQTISRDFFDGNMEITITDPDSGEVITVPTHTRPFVEPPTEKEPAKAPVPAMGFQ